MRNLNKLRALKSIFASKLFKKRYPLAVRWQITEKCPFSCIYCNRNTSNEESELDTNKIFQIVDELSEMGTVRISFSGGEPLMREDIGKIIDYCHKLNISTGLNSSGYLLERRINSLKNLDLLKISLDGPDKVNDFVRGKGSFSLAIKAAEIARDHGLKFTFATTLTKYNVSYVDYILELAEQFETVAAFQPLKDYYRGGYSKEIAPSKKQMGEFINKLIRLKRKGNKNIRNSLPGLNHISNWPSYDNLKCACGVLFCVIDTNGDVYACDRTLNDFKVPNCVSSSFQDAFNKIKIPHCSGCGFCGALELNFLFNNRFSVFKEVRGILS